MSFSLVQMAAKFHDARDQVKAIFGAKWRDAIKPAEEGIRDLMLKMGTNSELAATPRIRRLCATGMNRGELAAQFGIGKQNLHDVATRRSWKQIP